MQVYNDPTQQLCQLRSQGGEQVTKDKGGSQHYTQTSSDLRVRTSSHAMESLKPVAVWSKWRAVTKYEYNI